MRVTGKVWVVTGGAAGMGQELVRQLLAAGAFVAAVDRNPDALAQLATDLASPHLSTHAVDITDADAVRALPDAVIAAHGSVDGLINNAGIIQPFVPVVDLDDATIDKVMAVNFGGTLSMCRAFLPHLVARPEAHLANVSSMGGFFPFPTQTIYGASKAAVRLLTEGLFTELRDTNVNVSVIFPGAVRTHITENSGAGTEADMSADDSKVPMLTAEKAAAQMLEGIEKNRLHIHVGTDSKMMSLATKVAPKTAFAFVQRQMAKRMP